MIKAPKKRTRPAATDKAALSRWGLAGKPNLKAAPAYTAEDFEADLAAGDIPPTSGGCPVNRPASNCRCQWHTPVFSPNECRFVAGPAYPVPSYYVSTWRRSRTFPPLKPTEMDPHPRPRVVVDLIRVICFECRLSIRAAERARFVQEHGEYSLEAAPIGLHRCEILAPDPDEDGENTQVESSIDCGTIYVPIG